jgi:hypothetical protein
MRQPKFGGQHEYDDRLRAKCHAQAASGVESQLKGWRDSVIGRTKQWPTGLMKLRAPT